ncbi:hypothetical protein OCH239_12305 [Roseivivax halodurans JCM 10272]|uniref:Thiol-disulfide oxidoreductase n=1 Tax=Roseivivax halodurans JCM 10272 TaxID=1449350 RepID=X7EDT1_9RHOB|nr:DCC1-like thiol-disulfide oxidoreductase family protein [Roseivivax halodurans]ETX13283.1 hypothetical protein OCH239_12305 [Roseivivax halodurans JCM 10272]
MQPGNQASVMEIVYDGECPFCASWVRMVRLRERVGAVELVDARSGDPRPAMLAEAGYDLDRGMIVRWRGQVFHGDAALHLMAVQSGPGGVANSLQRRVFSSPRIAAAVYPWLVRGRWLALRMMGRGPIKVQREKSLPKE